MTFLTSFLFIFSGFMLMVAVLGISRRSAKKNQRESRLAEDMRSASRIARAAAMDAFEIELDGSDESIELLDHLVNSGWPAGSTAGANENASFVIGAYIGDLLVEHHGGMWRRDASTTSYPFVYFTQSQLAAKPFDFAKRKLELAGAMDLMHAYRTLVEEVTTPPVANVEPRTQPIIPSLDNERLALD